MLEYLFNFIEHNIILVFLCVLILSIASAYSKKAKIAFLTILVTAAIYFALLCLYRLGLGIDGLYKWSSRCVVYLCNQIDYCNIISLNNMVFLPKIMEFALHHSLSDACITMIETVILIFVILLVFERVAQTLNKIYFKKISINSNDANKIYYFSNTNNSTTSKYIFNLVLRC